MLSACTSTALAFLAGLDMAEAGLPYGLVVQTQPKSEVDTTAHKEAKFKLRYFIALAVCVVTVHMLAASTVLQLRRRLTGTTPPVGLDDDSDCGGKQPKSVLRIRLLKTYCLSSRPRTLRSFAKRAVSLLVGRNPSWQAQARVDQHKPTLTGALSDLGPRVHSKPAAIDELDLGFQEKKRKPRLKVQNLPKSELA